MKKKNILKTALLLAPCTAIMLFTVFIPVFTTFKYSLKSFKLTDPDNIKYIGFQNYRDVLLSRDFQSALFNSAVILVYVMIMGLCISFAVALVLNRKSKLNPLLTAIVVIPWALPPIVNGIMWKFIFFPGYGLLNKILLNMHIIKAPISWVTDRHLFLFAVSVVLIWRIVPFSAIVILANLQNIPEEYYESIYLEGSTKWQAFREITLPLAVPSLGVVLINLTTTAVNVFDEIIAISGYQFQNQTLLVYNYSNTFNYMDFGTGSAISYIIMILTGVFGYLYVRNMTVEKVY